MNDQLSIIELMLNATVVVQLVMFLLVAASVTSWVMILQRATVLNNATKTLTAFEEKFWSGNDLSELFREVNATDENLRSGVENIFYSGFKEFTRLRQQTGADSEAIMEGAQRVMRVALAREEEKLEKNLPFLATVGSTSPYVGLFGTVWGIMNSFRSLANASQATLATVAPGISEALVATAMGLFAAIPAVIAYNRYAAKVESVTGRYETFAEEFASILHRTAHAAKAGVA